MIKVLTSADRTLEPGQALTYDLTAVHTGCGRSERHQAGSSVIRLIQNGYYQVYFTANIGAVAPGAAQVTMQLDGEAIPGATAITPTAAAGDLSNVTIIQPVLNNCCDRSRITIVNSGTAPITVGAGAQLFVKRIS